jgi:hypothetical protein
MATNHARETPHVLLSSPINRVEFRAEKEEKKRSEKNHFTRKKEVKPSNNKNTPISNPFAFLTYYFYKKTKKKPKIPPPCKDPLSIPFIFFSHKPINKRPSY